MTIGKLISNLEKVNIKEVVGDVMDGSKEQLVRHQKAQLLRGERADGKKIGKYKNDAYARKKHAQNPLPGLGYMDWKLSGDLHSEVFADVRDNSVVLDSADAKTQRLIENHGDAFGLNEESVGDFVQETLAPGANRMIKSKIHSV